MTYHRNLVYKFFKEVYAYLNSIERCFYKGAFVFDDRNGDLIKLLNRSFKEKGDRLCGIFKSHDIFNKSLKCVRETHLPRTLDIRCPIGYFIEDGHLVKTNHRRNGHTPIVKMLNVKYYPFTYMNRNMVYAKLETSPSRSSRHVKKAFKTYVLKKKHKIKGYASRRESCKRASGIHEYDPEHHYWPGRKCDEFFIPQFLTDRFIRLITHKRRRSKHTARYKRKRVSNSKRSKRKRY